MNRGMYIAASGMLYSQKVTDTISNNLANASTNGFKRDIPVGESFPEVLLSKINDDDRNTINHKPFTGVVQNDTGEEGVYSLSINSGYFKVGTPAGISNSRELKFVVSNDGYLRTFSRDTDLDRHTVGENFVLDKSGKPIKLKDPGDIQIESNGNIVSGGQTAANIVDFPANHVIGTTNGGVRLSRIASDFTDGSYDRSEGGLDFAIKGDGFFKVFDDKGNQYYTRDGSFTMDSDGVLKTKDGYRVSTPGGQPGEPDVFSVENKHELRKFGHNLFNMEEGFEAREVPFEGEVLAGYLETSNVSAVKEMVQLITAFRNYESNQKIVQSQDELLSKVVNELGRV